MRQTSLYPEWEAAQTQTESLPRSIRTMYAMHARTAGRTCGECQHLIRIFPGQNSYLKCNLTVISRGPGTDWRRKWQACGAFVEAEA